MTEQMNKLILDKGKELDNYPVTPMPSTVLEDCIEWYLDNLWHDAKEPHDKNKKLIIKLIDGRYIFWQGSFDNIENRLHLYEAVGQNEIPRGIVVQWCYIDDLLPMIL